MTDDRAPFLRAVVCIVLGGLLCWFGYYKFYVSPWACEASLHPSMNFVRVCLRARMYMLGGGFIAGWGLLELSYDTVVMSVRIVQLIRTWLLRTERLK